MAKVIGQHADGSSCWTIGCSKMKMVSKHHQLLIDFQLEKQCSVCKQVLPKNLFAKNRARPDGVQSQCKECQGKINRASYRRTKNLQNPVRYAKRGQEVAKVKEYLASYKTKHPCVDCGQKVLATLDFDHRVGSEKLFNIGDGVFSKSLKTVKQELDKCDVRCANCHRIKTYGNLTWRTGNFPLLDGRSRISRNTQIAKQHKYELLLNHFAKGCVDCKNKDPRVLEMDHVRGQKAANISDMIRKGSSMAKFIEELDKCDVRCANCHRIVTRSREREQKVLSF